MMQTRALHDSERSHVHQGLGKVGSGKADCCEQRARLAFRTRSVVRNEGNERIMCRTNIGGLIGVGCSSVGPGRTLPTFGGPIGRGVAR